MGTRHIVEVINNGNTVLRQYGQWDGYAEIAGHHICEFIKKHRLELKDMMACTEIKPNSSELANDFHWKECTLAENDIFTTYTLRLSSIAAHMGLDASKKYLYAIPAVVEKFGVEKAMDYYMLTRDTGYRIFDIIYMFKNMLKSGKKIPVYMMSEDVDPGRKIIVNLDDETIEFKYFDKDKIYSFSHLPAKSILKKIDE